MTIYHHAFKVPFWVIVPEGDKTLMREFVSGGAVQKEFPKNFKDCIMAFKNKGYQGYLDREMPFPVDAQLLVRAAIEHTQAFFGSTSIMNGHVRGVLGRLDLKVKNDQDWERLYLDVLSAEPDDVISRLFKIADFHRPKGDAVFVTESPAPKNILTRLAGRVIEIGEESGDFVTKGFSKKTVFKEVQKSIEGDLQNEQRT